MNKIYFLRELAVGIIDFSSRSLCWDIVPDLLSGFNVFGPGYYLPLFSYILIAFRIGRIVGVESFDQ